MKRNNGTIGNAIEAVINFVGYAIGSVVALAILFGVFLVALAPVLLPVMAVACGGRYMGWW